MLAVASPKERLIAPSMRPPGKATGEGSLRETCVVVAAARPFPNADIIRFAMFGLEGAAVVKGV